MSEAIYTMTVDKDHLNISLIICKVRQLILSLDKYPGNLKITIEVDDND